MNGLLATLSVSLVMLPPFGALLGVPPKAGKPVIVFVPPWSDADKLVLRAGGQVVGPDVAPLAVLAYSEDPNFFDKLRLAGALGVSDGSILADLCGVREIQK